MITLEYDSLQERENQLSGMKEAVDLFEKLFGFKSESFIAPVYTWQRVRGYSSADYREYISTAGQHQNFLVANQLKYTAWFFSALQAIYYSYREKFFSPAIKSLYCMSLCVFSFVILIKGIETSFLRFALLYIIFSAVFCTHLFSKLSISSYLVRFMFHGIVAMNTLIMLRKTIEFTGVQVLSPNLLIIFFIDTDKSILNLFK